MPKLQMLVALSAVLLAACHMDPQETETSYPGSDRELRALTPRVDDARLSRGETAVTLDLRQASHKKFAEARLQFVGKTPANSPNLFARMEARGKATADPVAGLNDLGADCSSPFEVTQDPFDLTRWTARMITSCFAGADYSYADLFWWNNQTGELLAFDYVEDFTDPRDLELSLTADPALVGNGIYVDSMTINMRGDQEHYYLDSIIQQRPLDYAQGDNVAAPANVRGTPEVLVCLERGGSDCDISYYNPAHAANVRLPIDMKFAFPGHLTGVVKSIAQVHMTNSGGSCGTPDLAPYTTITNLVNGTSEVRIDTLGQPVLFGTRCVNNQARVRFWVSVVVTTTTPGLSYKMFWANDLATHPYHFDLMFRWSCLAEGSTIVMADGRRRPIEQISIGELVRGDRGEAFEVVDVSTGTESSPMVLIKSDHGGEILVTQGHPVFDGEGKALRADEVEVGSIIRTATGTTRVTEVQRKPYAGKVYNLKLGTDQQVAGLDVSRIGMSANGFLVGDARSQWALEMAKWDRIESAAEPTAEWAQDFLASKPRSERLSGLRLQLK